jgi:hypothetical protein
MSVAKNQREAAPESTWGQRFLASCSAVGQKACTEVGRHPFRTVYISAVAQRGRNSQLYPFQGHFSGIMSIHEREGPMGLLKGAAPRVAAEGLRVLLGAPGIDATAIELDARARRRKALRKTGVSAEMLSVGNELLIELGRVLVVTAITHPLELVATRLMTEDDSMCDLELSPQPGTMF